MCSLQHDNLPSLATKYFILQLHLVYMYFTPILDEGIIHILTTNHQVLLCQLISRISWIWGSYDWCRLTSQKILFDSGWTDNVTPLKFLSLLGIL